MEVLLARRITQAELESLGEAIRSQAPFERAFQSYHLPGMRDRNAGAWAVYHVTADGGRDARILGFSPDEFEAFVKKPIPPDATEIGRWTFEQAGALGFILLRQGNAYSLWTVVPDDGHVVEPLEPVPESENGRTWRMKDGTTVRVNARGELEFHDSEGLIRVALPVRVSVRRSPAPAESTR